MLSTYWNVCCTWVLARTVFNTSISTASSCSHLTLNMNGSKLDWRRQWVRTNNAVCMVIVILRRGKTGCCLSRFSQHTSLRLHYHYAALLGIKAYVEIFEGYMKKQKVDYENFRQSTHAAIALFLASSLAYNIALWPHYGWNSIIVLSLAFFGVILQFLLLVPAWVQNIAGFALFTFFLQEYKWLRMSSGAAISKERQ